MFIRINFSATEKNQAYLVLRDITVSIYEMCLTSVTGIELLVGLFNLSYSR